MQEKMFVGRRRGGCWQGSIKRSLAEAGTKGAGKEK